jgi:H+/Cl- antiporter ClcA
MRMTLTVVVIMFELTGALTYILPTMVRVVHGIEWRLSLLLYTRVDRFASDQVCW